MEEKRLMGSSSSSSSTRKLTETYLTDDLWHEIFLHLPIDPVFKFRCVSKVWLSILSNPNFIKKWEKLNTASLWTLVHAGFPENEIPVSRKFTFLYPELSSPFMSHHHNSFSFLFLSQTHDFSNTDLFIVGSSKGLVLCTNNYLIQTSYYVCNPLTKRWVSLPPPPKRGRGYVAAGFTCEEEEPCLISTTFKVIRVPLFVRANGIKVDIFSSDLGKWHVYDVVYPPEVSWKFSAYDNFFTLDGVFYWMQKAYKNILAFSVNKTNIHEARDNECRLIKLPDSVLTGDMNMYISRCLGESEGLICYATVQYTEMSLSVWVLEEDWNLLHKDIKFYRMISQIESLLIGVESSAALIRKIQVLGFNPLDKNVVILVYEKYVWAYNIRTGGYEELSHLSFLRSNHSAPYVSILAFAIKPRPTKLPPVCW